MHQLIIATKDIHDQNVIHRDLKLGNLLLTDKLEIRVGDFTCFKFPPNHKEEKLCVELPTTSLINT